MMAVVIPGDFGRKQWSRLQSETFARMERDLSADQQMDEAVIHAEEEGRQLARDLMATIERRNLGLAGRLAALSAVLRCVLSVPGGMPAAWNACQGEFERTKEGRDDG